jgi:glycosyltransferase involved in cell wall biosynthesis
VPLKALSTSWHGFAKCLKKQFMIPAIICFSHLRWNFVYQRPQHLMMRFAAVNKVFYVEEPIFNTGWSGFKATRPSRDHQLTVLVPHLSGSLSPLEMRRQLSQMLNEYVAAADLQEYICWYYSPMAIEYTAALSPITTIYDCMDELSAFKFAPDGLRENESRLFTMADVVFTGGHSLYAAKKQAHNNIHAFPSSIDKAHFMQARTTRSDPADQLGIGKPRLGFYGVLDERLDIDLISAISASRPDWHFILIGPTVKIDPQSLPRRSNIHYLGPKKYEELPQYLAGWDIAFMPFALNDSTRFISPTKTPEYLAGGKPVISTAIADVVNDYANHGLVKIINTPSEFISAAEEIFNNPPDQLWLRQVDTHLFNASWDATWLRMAELIKNSVNAKRMFYDKYLNTCSITL